MCRLQQHFVRSVSSNCVCTDFKILCIALETRFTTISAVREMWSIRADEGAVQRWPFSSQHLMAKFITSHSTKSTSETIMQFRQRNLLGKMPLKFSCHNDALDTSFLNPKLAPRHVMLMRLECVGHDVTSILCLSNLMIRHVASSKTHQRGTSESGHCALSCLVTVFSWLQKVFVSVQEHHIAPLAVGGHKH